MILHEFKCARCAKVFIAAERASGEPSIVRCPSCQSANVTRLASVYSTVDMSVQPAEDEQRRAKAGGGGEPPPES